MDAVNVDLDEMRARVDSTHSIITSRQRVEERCVAPELVPFARVRRLADKTNVHECSIIQFCNYLIFICIGNVSKCFLQGHSYS